MPQLEIYIYKNRAILRRKFIRNSPASEISRNVRRDLCEVSPVSGTIFKTPFPGGVFAGKHFSLASWEANKKIRSGTHGRYGCFLGRREIRSNRYNLRLQFGRTVSLVCAHGAPVCTLPYLSPRFPFRALASGLRRTNPRGKRRVRQGAIAQYSSDSNKKV